MHFICLNLRCLQFEALFCIGMSLIGFILSVLGGKSFKTATMLSSLVLATLLDIGCKNLSAWWVLSMSFFNNSSVFFVRVGNRSITKLFRAVSSVDELIRSSRTWENFSSFAFYLVFFALSYGNRLVIFSFRRRSVLNNFWTPELAPFLRIKEGSAFDSTGPPYSSHVSITTAL